MKQISDFLTISLISGTSEERFCLCLKSLLKALAQFPYRLIVTDNASDFDVSKHVNHLFKNAKIISNESVLTYAKNQNRVLKECQSNFILMLKDDVELIPTTVHKLKICLERHPASAIAAPALYRGELSEKPQLAGTELTRGLPVTWKLPIYYLMREMGGMNFYESYIGYSHLRDQPLAYIKSRLFLARSKMLMDAGGFDEDYIESGEDLDFGKKLRGLGYELYQAEDAKCISYKKLSLEPVSWEGIFESWERYNQKYHPGFVALVSRFLAALLKMVLKTKGARKKPEDIKGKEFHKILLFKTGTAKDYLLLTPAIRALKKRYPEARLVLYGTSHASEVFKNNSNLDEVREIPIFFIKNPISLFKPSNFKAARDYLKELKLDRWDLFISFQSLFSWVESSWLWLLTKFSGSPYCIGFNNAYKGLFFTHRINDERESRKHATRKNLDLLHYINVSSKDFETTLSLTEEEKSFGNNWLLNNHFKKDNFIIAVHAGAVAEGLERTSWPKEYFIEVLNQLIERHGVKILLTSSQDPREINLTHYIRDKVLSPPAYIEPELGLKKISSILSCSQMILANDSDVLHAGISSGVPTIGIFGPSDYRLYGAYGDEANFKAFYRPINCRPCVNHYCSDPVCLKTITPEIILEEASRMIVKMERQGVRGAQTPS